MPNSVTADNILELGLELAGYDLRRQRRFKEKNRIKRFRKFYGSTPFVLVQVWNDLPAELIIPKFIKKKRIGKIDVSTFLMSMHYLKRYPTYSQLSGMFSVSERSIAKKVWTVIYNLQLLKTKKVSWCVLYLFTYA